MSEAALAREFLDIVAELEALLRDQGAPDARGLGGAVHTLADTHSLVRRHRSDLLAFAALRNAIAHNRYQAGRPIATPLPETVSAARQVLSQLKDPVAAAVVACAPLTFSDDAELQPVLQELASRQLSQAPITDADGYRCLLTTNAVARWLAAAIDDEGNVVMPTVRVGDVLPHLEPHEKARFVPRTLSASEAVDILTGPQPPLALLITHGGKKHQAMLGILTLADVPALFAALGDQSSAGR